MPRRRAPSARDSSLRSTAYQRRRIAYLREHPLCAECVKRGVVTAAAELDHVVALRNGGRDEWANYQGLCVPCHKAKTAADMGYTPRQRIGIDGWPEAEGVGGSNLPSLGTKTVAEGLS